MADQRSNEGTSHWLTTLTSGDWLKVPGAVKAIGRLVTSVGNIGAAGIEVGTAKLEQISHGIRDDTAAKSALQQPSQRLEQNMRRRIQLLSNVQSRTG